MTQFLWFTISKSWPSWNGLGTSTRRQMAQMMDCPSQLGPPLQSWGRLYKDDWYWHFVAMF